MLNRMNLVVAGLLFALVGCGDGEPKPVSDATGKYKVLMPGTPKTQTQPAAGMTMHVQSYEEGNGAFMVAYVDTPIPDNESEAEIQTRLDGSRDGALANISGKLVSESKIKLADKYHGREFRGDIPKLKGVVVARVYLVGSRLYQVMAVGKASWVDRDVIKKCLASLELVP